MTVVLASSPEDDSAALQIGEWRLDVRGNELRRGDTTLRLERKAIEVLACLAARPGEVLTREELLDHLWPGLVVGDDVLTQAIIKLRKALGDDSRAPRYIDTVPKRGYRLIAPVRAVDTGHRHDIAAEPPARSAAGLAAGPPARSAAVRRPSRTGWLLLGGVVAALIGAAAWHLVAPRDAAPSAGETAATGNRSQAKLPIVAVLPLSDPNGDAAREYLSDGLTIDIIHALGRFSGLRVMSHGSVQGYKGQAATPMQVGRQLGARYVVQGSVRVADGRIRVTVALSDALGGELLGSETYEGANVELFEIQDRIVRQIVARLHLNLTQVEQQRAFARPTGNLESHDLLLRARALHARSDRASNREARLLLEQALAQDPQHAEARSALGEAEFQRAARGWVEDGDAAVRRAEALAREVLASVDVRAHARAHTLLAMIFNHQGHYQEAEAQARQATAHNPSDPVALYQSAAAALSMGRVDESIRLHEMARQFEPHPRSGDRLSLCLAYFVAGRPADALVEAERVLSVVPRHAPAQAMKAAALAATGRIEPARRAAAEVRRMDPLFDVDAFGGRFEDPAYAHRLREGLRAAGL